MQQTLGIRGYTARRFTYSVPISHWLLLDQFYLEWNASKAVDRQFNAKARHWTDPETLPRTSPPLHSLFPKQVIIASPSQSSKCVFSKRFLPKLCVNSLSLPF